MYAPPSPNHIIDFRVNESALELEDPVMKVEEDPMEDPEEDQEEDLGMDIDEDEEDEWEEDDEWLMALVTPPRASSFQLIVAAMVSLHHKEIGALCVRVDKIEYMQTSLVRKTLAEQEVDALREEVDGLNGWTETMNQRVHTLKSALQEVRTENQDLQTRLSASESNERCMVACILWLKERINALDQRPPGPPDGSQIMPPKRLKRRAIERMVKRRVTEAITKYERNRPNLKNAGGSGPANAGGFVAPEEDKVKFAACTFEGRALTWWNGNVHTLGLTNANQIPWNNVKTMMTTEYCPATEIQRMEQEL
ncbi:hypothetical protein Tco_1210339 [Tanacetum coccineum]